MGWEGAANWRKPVLKNWKNRFQPKELVLPLSGSLFSSNGFLPVFILGYPQTDSNRLYQFFIFSD